jgi:fatty acid desaturase
MSRPFPRPVANDLRRRCSKPGWGLREHTNDARPSGVAGGTPPQRAWGRHDINVGQDADGRPPYVSRRSTRAGSPVAQIARLPALTPFWAEAGGGRQQRGRRIRLYERVAATGFERGQLRTLHLRSDLKGTSIFLMDLLPFAASIAFCIATSSLLLKVVFAIVAGVMTSLLFVVGHDACHQSLTSRRWLNRMIGTLSFLPCLHAFSFWDLGHNRIHHRFTNRRGKDYVWEPLTHPEFVALSGFQRLKYRFFRTLVGHYWYYLCEIWWKKMFFPCRSAVGRYTTENVIDHIVLLMWILLWPSTIVALTWFVSATTAGPYELGMSVLLCCVVPFLVFNLLMSSVIYLHHMHPKVGWVRGDARVDVRRLQMLASVHSRVSPHHGAHGSPPATRHSALQPRQWPNDP